jgi:hypothetical protein
MRRMKSFASLRWLVSMLPLRSPIAIVQWVIKTVAQKFPNALVLVLLAILGVMVTLGLVNTSDVESFIIEGISQGK